MESNVSGPREGENNFSNHTQHTCVLGALGTGYSNKVQNTSLCTAQKRQELSLVLVSSLPHSRLALACHRGLPRTLTSCLRTGGGHGQAGAASRRPARVGSGVLPVRCLD